MVKNTGLLFMLCLEGHYNSNSSHFKKSHFIRYSPNISFSTLDVKVTHKFTSLRLVLFALMIARSREKNAFTLSSPGVNSIKDIQSYKILYLS